MASATQKSARVAVVGADTLLGREVEDVLGSGRITSFAATGEGSFAEQEGEAVFVKPLDATSIREHAFVILAGAPEGARRAYELAKVAKPRPLLIDCQGDLENQAESRVGVPGDSWLVVPAHPAAQALAMALGRLAKAVPVTQSIANIFEPASERGRKGIAELQSQTTNLLSFKGLDKAIYDAQVAFNLLPRVGEDAPVKLSGIEHRIERHLASLLSRSQTGIPMPSLRLLQAPVFHGYSISLWVELERAIPAQQAAEALATAQIEVRGDDQEPPGTVGVAGQSGLIVGDIRVDSNNNKALWIWVVADNLRLMAESAAAIVRGEAQ